MFRALRQPNHDTGPAAPDGTRLADVPIRVRSASNPGGPGHNWVKNRFVDPETRHLDVLYLPSRLADNPHLDSATYIGTLGEMPHAERERLLHGDWEIPDDGELFQRHWFEIIEPHQLPPMTTSVRYWDLAGTAPNPANRDPDWTVGLRLDLDKQTGIFYISDLVRERKAPGAVERLVLDTAKRDGRSVAIRIEQEPGASGAHLIDRFKRKVLRGYNVSGRRETGAKDLRARPAAAAAEYGLVKIVRSRHLNDLLDELTAFPHGRHDDIVDALSGAHLMLSGKSGTPAKSGVPRGRIPTTTHTRRNLRTGRDPIADLASQLGATIYDSH